MTENYEWMILYKIRKQHMIILPSWQRVLLWIGKMGAKCTAIKITRCQKAGGRDENP